MPSLASLSGANARLLSVLTAAALCLSITPPLGAAAATKLVTNGSFDTNVNGWVTNQSYTTLKRTTSAHDGAGAAVLTTKAGKNAVLNDSPNSVTGAKKGARYAVSVWVRTAQPNLSGQLRVRQVSAAGTTTSGTSFWLTSKSWQKVSLDLVTARDGSDLDVSVLGWSMAKGQTLYVDTVSLALVAPSAPPTAPAGPVTGGTAKYAMSDGAGVSARGVPLNGALFGATYGSNNDPTPFEQQVGQRLGVHRTFWAADEVDQAVAASRADLAAGRLPWISFKLPYGWPNMSKGKGDKWATDIAKKLAKLPGPVWVAFHHEPEGDGNIKDWIKIQERLSPIVRSTAPNVAYTVIYTGYYQFYGDKSEYLMKNIWPNTKIDVVGFDPYQQYGVVKNGSMVTNATPMKTAYFAKFEAFAASKGVAWGIAETAISDPASNTYPNLMLDTYRDLVATHGVAMAYFNTHLHSKSSWSILTPAKTNSYSAALKASPMFPRLV